jgi:hypothetical protein
MKEKELREHAVCSICGKKILADGILIFYVMTLERFGIDMKTVEEQQKWNQCLQLYSEQQ